MIFKRCLNCKNRRRKCDEAKPVCGRCSSKNDKCEWDTRLTFRVENALGIARSDGQPSLRRKPPLGGKRTRFVIKDVTAEVIRDYQHTEPVDAALCESNSQPSATPFLPPADRPTPQVPASSPWHGGPSFRHTAGGFTHQQQQHHHHQQHELGMQRSEEGTASAPIPLSNPEDFESVWNSPTAASFIDDSLFLPGSAYFDAHSTLRSHLMYEVRSNVPTRQVTPDAYPNEDIWPTRSELTVATVHNADMRMTLEGSRPEGLSFSQSSILPLSDEEEFALWKNWLDEVAPWLDKFDSEQHFRHTLPVMARSHDHLRYSILAVSARQLERKQKSRHTERSLSLYQTAIQLVLPQLHTRSTPVIASCVVLCVLEMLSSSAKAWHQHLDGCAHLIEAVGINGFAGGVNQALFWCFARMDVCGGLIASSKSLIPVDHWAPGIDLDADVNLFNARSGFDAYACHAVYLCAQVLDLLSLRPHLAERVGASPPAADGAHGAYTTRWVALWRYIDDWHSQRPAEMLPIKTVTVSTKPFPMILYSNPAAISGNQLYHMACILMLRHKPAGLALKPKANSIFWHARQTCAISISNDHHGAWTNAVQPLWIAGQWMSHESEQKEILRLLERIENETGWGTKRRAEDLREFWG